MTNETEEVTVEETERRREEAPPMPLTTGHNSDSESSAYDDHFPLLSIQDENENSTIGAEEEELFVAVGNAAKAARTKVSTLPMQKDEQAEGNTCTVSVERYERITRNTNAYADDNNVNEVATFTTATTENTTSTTTADDGGLVLLARVKDDDHEDDYVVGLVDVEEEATAYKTEWSTTRSQSEEKIQQQQQHPPQTEGLAAAAAPSKSFISNLNKVGPFLDQTWNWLRYFLVTIILLNLKLLFSKIANRLKRNSTGDSVVSCAKGEVDKENTEQFLEEESCEASGETSMSPNTCSIQNQEEVEKAEEAIMAVGLNVEQAVVGEEKVAQVQSATTAVVETQKEENKMPEQQQQQITVILPSDDQVVVVVSGEEDQQSSSLSEEDDSNLAAIRRDSVDSYASSEGSGNLGDIETEICDKSSEDGTSSVGTTEETSAEGKAEVAQKIIAQVESMFSDEHLAKDGFLLKHVRRRSDGFVSLKLVAGLRKVKQISREFPVVLDALKDSTKLEINPEGTKVRRVEPLTPLLKSLPIKSKEKDGKEGKGTSSNDENQQSAIQQNKPASKFGNKENSQENGFRQGANGSRRNSNATGGNQSRRNSNSHQQTMQHHHQNRKGSNTSTSASSNNSSRHNSFSKAAGIPPNSQHPADLFRNVYMAAYSSSGEDSPQVGRRRGGSLPVAAMQQHRGSMNAGSYLSPNSSPPNGTLVLGPNGARPKSNSYCEGVIPSSMSPWLQRRKASASRLSSGELVFTGVIRQPKGPDGTKGFATGYRAMILEERLQQQQNSAVSA